MTSTSLTLPKISYTKDFLHLLVIFFAFILLGSGLSWAIQHYFGIDVNYYESTLGQVDLFQRMGWRCLLLVNHLFFFVLPSAFFFAYYLRKDPDILRWKQLPSVKVIILILGLVLGSYGIVAALAYINELFPLPSYLQAMEDQTQKLIGIILTCEYFYEFLFNLVLVAIIPAIGEELFFRGIIQSYIKSFLNPLWAIVVTALIFSAAHGQFEGFLPRFFLGLLLGWLFQRSGSITLPILTHCIFNGIQVVIQYTTQAPIDQEPWDALPYYQILGSGVLCAIPFFYCVYILNHEYFAIKSTKHRLEDLNDQFPTT